MTVLVKVTVILGSGMQQDCQPLQHMTGGRLVLADVAGHLYGQLLDDGVPGPPHILHASRANSTPAPMHC